MDPALAVMLDAPTGALASPGFDVARFDVADVELVRD